MSFKVGFELIFDGFAVGFQTATSLKAPMRKFLVLPSSLRCESRSRRVSTSGDCPLNNGLVLSSATLPDIRTYGDSNMRQELFAPFRDICDKDSFVLDLSAHCNSAVG